MSRYQDIVLGLRFFAFKLDLYWVSSDIEGGEHETVGLLKDIFRGPMVDSPAAKTKKRRTTHEPMARLDVLSAAF
jgi:hypothetical protein